MKRGRFTFEARCPGGTARPQPGGTVEIITHQLNLYGSAGWYSKRHEVAERGALRLRRENTEKQSDECFHAHLPLAFMAPTRDFGIVEAKRRFGWQHAPWPAAVFGPRGRLRSAPHSTMPA